MRFLNMAKDGGPKSKVMGYWLIEIKKLFTVAILRFDKGSREAYHTHSFKSYSWLLSGGLQESMKDGTIVNHKPSLRPILTERSTFHKVYGVDNRNWVLTFRGPWKDKWQEEDESGNKIILTHHRKEIR